MAVTINGSGVVDVGANASSSAYVRLYEDTDNGTNYVDLIAPSSIASNKTITLPDVTGTAVTTGDTGSITSTMLATAVKPLGVGQSYTDVTASRAIDTTYTNSTGRPIFIVVTVSGYNGGAPRSSAALVVNGSIYGTVYTNEYYSASALTPGLVMVIGVIPDGQTYRVTTAGNPSTLSQWSELR